MMEESGPQPNGKQVIRFGVDAVHDEPNTTNPDPEAVQHHKDGLNRYTRVSPERSNKDHFLRSSDGKLSVLGVQRAPGYNRPADSNSTWSDPPKENIFKKAWVSFRNIPLGVLAWTYNDRIKSQSGQAREDGNQAANSLVQMCCKYIVACFVLTLTALFGNFGGTVHPGGRYPPVRYGYFCYPKTARNQLEGSIAPRSKKETLADQHTNGSVVSGDSHTAEAHQDAIIPWSRSAPRNDEYDGAFGRHLRPRFLCVVPENGRPATRSEKYNVVDVDQWDQRRLSSISGEYVFVSYTRLQFQTYRPEEIDQWDPPATQYEARERQKKKRMFEGDLQQLYEIGFKAAVNAGVSAFWIDMLCMTAETSRLDAHRICDIARGANRMVIALNESVEDRIRERSRRSQSPSTNELLYHWGCRVWTLPEMLLAPSRHDMELWRPAPFENLHPFETIPKRNMAERAYRDDGLLIRQLVDHFEANLQMTQTELLTIALQSLTNRDTKPYMAADPIYALMTLARRRPLPRKDQSLFEAFAELSLMNDSNMLLERLVCMLPPRRGEQWHKVQDFWGVKLWDIFPQCQVAAIVDDQTVLLDGAFGASIEWARLSKVGFLKRKTIWKSIGEFLVRFAPGWLILSILLLAVLGRPIKTEDYNYKTGKLVTHSSTNPAAAAGVIFFLIAFACIATLPAVMFSLYGGKFWSTQAVLFGLEGVPELDWLEAKLFGFSNGRLKWSASSSTQSQHQLKTTRPRIKNEFEATRPLIESLPLADNVPECQSDTDRQRLDGGVRPVDPDRVFTIVDTYSMTVTTFRSVHPPSVALICGHEGGMQRAVLCSYNYKTQTFHRETVIRMPTKVLDRIDRIDKFRFSLDSMPLRG